MKLLKIVKIDSNYCDYLRKFDSKVSYNKGQKENRPFVGVLFKVKDVEYFAPLSSPKKKHLALKNNIDCMKIAGGKLGVVNFNNMIPLYKKYYTVLDLDKNTFDIREKKYLNLLKNQREYLIDNIKELQTKSKVLYELYCNGNINEKLKNRCCNYPLLEEKAKEYK